MGTIQKKDILKICQKAKAASRQISLLDSKLKNEILKPTKIYVKEKKINFHTTHIPPGSSNGWIKIETLEGIYKRIEELKNELNILCGDFNTPKDENPKEWMFYRNPFLDPDVFAYWILTDEEKELIVH